jgi:hypothetical protein
MQEKLIKINGGVQKCRVFTQEEIKTLFADDNWNRTTKDPSFLQLFGLTPPNGTFLAAGSYADFPDHKERIAGICVLRIDEKDAQKGYPVNWNHWDFISKDDEVIMIPKENKKEIHWFKSKEAWEAHIKENPPHETD